MSRDSDRAGRKFPLIASVILPIAAVALGWYAVVPDRRELIATGNRRSLAQIHLQSLLERHELWQGIHSLKMLSWELFVRRSFHRGTWMQCADATGRDLMRRKADGPKVDSFKAIEKECGPAPNF
jgi:hypothetical protein